MSVPAAKALSPAPVRIIALTDGSWSSASQICAIRSYIANVRALRACGRLKVSRAMPSRTSNSRSASAPEAGTAAVVCILVTLPVRSSFYASGAGAGKPEDRRGSRPVSGFRPTAQALGQEDEDAAERDDAAADPGPQVRDLTEDDGAEHGRPDDLRVVERRDERRRRELERAHEAVVPEAAEHAQRDEQQRVPGVHGRPPHERE